MKIIRVDIIDIWKEELFLKLSLLSCERIKVSIKKGVKWLPFIISLSAAVSNCQIIYHKFFKLLNEYINKQI